MADALSDEFLAARERDLQSRVSAKRLAHIHGVADTAAQLARRYGVDVRHARLAGMLHDWDKGFDDAGIRQRVRELGMQVDPFVYDHLPRVLHSNTAPVALAREFPEIPAEVLQAIDRHTVAARSMSKLDMVLYIADAIEPNRTGKDVEALRERAPDLALEDLYFEVYCHWLVAMLDRGLVLHPNTIDIWNDMAIRRRAGKDAK